MAFIEVRELERLRDDAEHTLLDKFQIGTPQESVDWEPSTPGYDWSNEKPCGLEIHRDANVGDETHSLPGTTATLTYPLDVELETDQMVRVTKIVGEVLEKPMHWTVTGAPQRGISLHRAELKLEKVEDDAGYS